MTEQLSEQSDSREREGVWRRHKASGEVWAVVERKAATIKIQRVATLPEDIAVRHVWPCYWRDDALWEAV